MSSKSLFLRSVLAIAAGSMMGVASLTISTTTLAASAPTEKPAAAEEEKKPIHILFTNVNIFDGFSPQIEKGMSVLVEDNFIKEVGKKITKPEGAYVVDGEGRTMTPGLIDCHTHLVYGGDRAREFELRLEGASYEEIARNGGGIVSTVKSVRRASVDQLVEASLPRVQQLLAEGVTTLEIKSGYGLDSENEIKMLEAARRIGNLTGIRVIKTFLGAHAFPEEYAGRGDDYVDLVCGEMLDAVAEQGLADAVDAFCEGIALDPAQTELAARRANG